MRSDSEIATRLLGAGMVALVESTPDSRPLSHIRLRVGQPFAGPSVTVELPAGDNLGVHLALEAAGAGAVVCVASLGRGVYGVVGELLAESARVRGAAAFVIDDGIRDLGALVAPPAIAARGVSPRGTVKRRVRRPVNTDVSVGGALVRAGDWIVADADGVCVVPAGDLENGLAAAESRVAREDALRETLRGGVSTRRALGLPSDATASIG